MAQPPLRVVLVDDHKMVVDGSATMPSRFADRVRWRALPTVTGQHSLWLHWGEFRAGCLAWLT